MSTLSFDDWELQFVTYPKKITEYLPRFYVISQLRSTVTRVRGIHRQEAADEREQANTRRNYLESELKTAPEALETVKEEMTEVTSKYETGTAGARAGLVHGEASAMAMEEVEVANLQQQAMAELQEARNKTDGLVAELEAGLQVEEASEKDMGETLELAEGLAKGKEVANFVKQATNKLQEAQTRVDSLVSEEPESTREDLKAGEEKMADAVSNHEAKRKDARST